MSRVLVSNENIIQDMSEGASLSSGCSYSRMSEYIRQMDYYHKWTKIFDDLVPEHWEGEPKYGWLTFILFNIARSFSNISL